MLLYGELTLNALFCTIVFPTVASKWGAIVVNVVMGLLPAIHCDNIFVVLEKVVDPRDRGMFTGAMNMGMVVAQVCYGINLSILIYYGYTIR